VDEALKSVSGVKSHTAAKGAKSFEVTGDFNDKEVFGALQRAGLTGQAGKREIPYLENACGGVRRERSCFPNRPTILRSTFTEDAVLGLVPVPVAELAQVARAAGMEPLPLLPAP
jgi:hypothetical protein